MSAELKTFLFLLVVSITQAQKYFVIGPNVFRLNVEETVSVQVWQTTKVEVYLRDQLKSKVISKVTKVMEARKPEIVKLKITEDDLPSAFTGGKAYFFLVVKGPGFVKESQVLLDVRGGTVFIQTDKPIYTPKESVKYRVIPVGIDLRPLKQKIMLEVINPQGIRVRRIKDIKAWERGFETKDFPLGDLPTFGTWTITASFGKKKPSSSNTTFAVKEYVLPTFLVRITPPSFVSSRDKMIPIVVSAKYSFGKNVNGLVRLKLSLESDDGKDVEILDERGMIFGVETFNIKADKIIAPKSIASFPFGRRLKIFAVVTERATGTMEKASDSSAVLVRSPYTISFEGTVKYFTPDLSFRVRVDLRYPNKRPAKGKKLQIDATVNGKPLTVDGDSSSTTTNGQGQAFLTLNMPHEVTSATQVIVKARTKSDSDENSEATVILRPYNSAAKNYVHVRPSLLTPKIGEHMFFNVFIPQHANGKIDQLNYLVVARGRIVYQAVILKTIGVDTSLSVIVTAEMSPKCRLLVYYQLGNDIAADSTLIDMPDGYANKVKIDVKNKDQITPNYNLNIDIETQKNSLVGLLAVDQSVYYLRNKSRLIDSKVFKDIGSFDLGCGYGAGKDNRDVFDNAGLMAITNQPFTTTTRQELSCPGEKKTRKRRSIGGKASVLAEKCCIGRCCSELKVRENAKCKDLKHFILPSCWDDFYKCCRIKFEVRGRSLANNDNNFDDDDEFIEDGADVAERQFFPETWIWVDKKTGDKYNTQVSFTVPDSITTWEVAAISVNSETGLGLSNIIELPSSTKLFIHIKMPYSVKRLEQITVYAVIYNYDQEKIRARLFLKGHQSFCSIAKPGQRSSPYGFTIPKNDAVAIPFTIIPLIIGNSPIEFFVGSSSRSDKIVKELNVVPEGVQRRETFSLLLDPQGIMEAKGKQGKAKRQAPKKDKKNVFDGVRNKNGQTNWMQELSIPEAYVKNSEIAMVYVTGNLMGTAVEDIINGGLTKLIQLPTGCGEQTMMKLAPLTYVLSYLYSLKNAVTSEIESKAYGYMRQGYNHELKWRRTDKSYSVWGQKSPPCTWLTAFVNKVFCKAREYIKEDIDDVVICESLQYLESIQGIDGSFAEKYAVRHREMIGNVNSKLSLTAYVVVSLLECEKACPAFDSVVLSKATAFLDSNIKGIKSGYIMSLVTYALAIAQKGKSTEAYNKLIQMLTSVTSKGREVSYIKDGGPALQVEATAYTLLTMAAMNKLDNAGPLVIWLTEQRNAKGAFYSTQDTVIALQALSVYSSKTQGGELDLLVTLTSAKDKNIKKTFKITPANSLIRQQAEITAALGEIIYIDTKGKGTAQLQIETTYNMPSTNEEQCGYIINIDTKEIKDDTVNDGVPGADLIKPKKKKKCKKNKKKKNKKDKCKKKKKTKKGPQKDAAVPNKITVTVCAKHKFSNGSSMTMIEVGLLTGFVAVNSSLEQLLSKGGDPKIDKYEINQQSIIFYLGKISDIEETCLSFTCKRRIRVGDLQAVPVKVYDYYEPADGCTKFYGPKKNSLLLKTICGDGDGDQCQCSQGLCPTIRSTNSKSLKKMACLKTDFVFSGLVVEVRDLNSGNRIAIIVEAVYKMGNKESVVGEKVHIYATKSCAYPQIKKNEKYLIMVKDGLHYALDDESYILPWPTESRKIKKITKALDAVVKGDVCDNFELDP